MYSGYKIPMDPNINNAFRAPRTVANLPTILDPISDYEEDLDDYISFTEGDKELKHFDTGPFGLNTLDGGGVIYGPQDATYTFLNYISEGFDDNERIGNRIRMRSIHVRGTFSSLYSGGSIGICGYLWIIYDALGPNNNTPPAVNEIFSGSAPHTAFMDLDNARRFKVIGKIAIDLPPTVYDGASVYGQTKHFELFEPLDLPVQYSSEAGSEINKGAIYTCWGSNLYETLLIVMNSRICFTDD